MSSTELAKSSAVSFEGVSPILRVQDLPASTDYYVRTLGFAIDWQGPYFASVSRGNCHIFLSQGDQGQPGTWVWIGVEDADALWEEYRRTGAKLRNMPTNYPWAYELQIEDLDGNVLRLGSDSKKNEPTGEWLDMHRQRWVLLPDGGWRRKE
jgi:catechol 2,3-dioxygenase-like lactoylglutathione lyase family enzyme